MPVAAPSAFPSAAPSVAPSAAPATLPAAPPDPGPSAAPAHPAQRPEPPGPQQALQAQAHENEQQGRWLGAITAWRTLARATRPGEALYETARQKLFGLAGLSWMAPIKSRESLPLVVGRSVVLVPHKVRNGDTVRHVVTGVSLDNGQVLWTREDAVAFPYKDDPVAFVHNREHVTRIDLKTGGDLWEHRFLGQSPDTGPRQVLGLSGDRVIVLGDTWPAALDLQSGRILWGPNPLGRSGYAAFVTEHGVLAWPKGPKPPHVATSEWRNLPVVMLSYEKGEILWQRTLIPGDPWRLVVAGDRMYASDAHLASELPWAAISLKNGQTVWRQPQGEARPSALVALPNVLVDRPLDERKSRVTYFRDPATGRARWQSDRVATWFETGPVLETDAEGNIVARDLITGQTTWQMISRDPLRVDPTAAVSGAAIYLPAIGRGTMSGGEMPALVASQVKTGQVAWTQQASDTPYLQEWRLLGVAGDQVMVEQVHQIAKARLTEKPRSTASTLVAFDVARGDVAWGFWDLSPARSSPPLRVGNMLLVVGQDAEGCTLYCFDVARIQELVRGGRRWWW